MKPLHTQPSKKLYNNNMYIQKTQSQTRCITNYLKNQQSNL